MSHGYRLVQWNRFKVGYDLWIVAGAATFFALFFLTSAIWVPPGESFHPVQTAMRALGACAFLLLSLTLSIGPLTRLTRHALPLLYNRRHLGIATFLVALAHGGVSLLWYFGFSKLNPALALLFIRPLSLSPSTLPFELLGAAALIVLLLLAATSHDYWQKVMTPLRWKRLHMAVYAAYGLVVAHVAFGPLMEQPTGLYPLLVMIGAGLVAGLHVTTAALEAWRQGRAERTPVRLQRLAPGPHPEEDWLLVGRAQDIPDGRAVIVAPPDGERIAVFRDGPTLYAVTNVCPHQNGPLGEGRIIDGCIACPWHGWQFRPADGRSPPPFDEAVATYRLRLEGETVYVRPVAMPSGSPTGLVWRWSLS